MAKDIKLPRYMNSLYALFRELRATRCLAVSVGSEPVFDKSETISTTAAFIEHLP